MSSTNEALNLALESLKEYNLKDIYINNNIIEPTSTTLIENTIISYNKEVGIVFCNICFINLYKSKILEHLKNKHSILYKEYINKNLITNITNITNTLDLEDFTSLLNKLSFNRYYFKEINIIFNGYKCRECFYINPYYKEIRKHYNKKHLEGKSNRRTNIKANYILENVPIEIISSNIRNIKGYFIPRLPFKEIIDRVLDFNTSNSPRVIIDLMSSNSLTLRIDPTIKENIIEDYKENLKRDESNTNYININNNKDLLTSFYKNSNILDFFNNKNKSILLDLIASPSLSSILIEPILNNNNINILDYIEELTLSLGLEISDKINKISRRLRQLLKEDSYYTNIKNSRDFRSLESLNTKRTYFNYFSRLITYIIRVSYIKENYKDSTNPKDLEIYNTIKDIRLNSNIKEIIKDIFKLNIIESNINTLDTKREFNSLITKIFYSLLDDINYISSIRNTTLDNIVITYFFINTLDSNSGEFISINRISKISSIFIYNSRLYFLGYYLIREEVNLIEDSNITIERELDKIITKDIKKRLTNNSSNYFEELTQIRSYTKALDKSTLSENFSISENKVNIIEYNTIEYPIATLREFFSYILITLEDTLKIKLLGLENLDTLNINYNTINDSFLYNKTNSSIRDLEEFEPFKVYFLNNLLTSNTYYNRIFIRSIDSNTNNITFKRAKIEAFNSDINYFLEVLAIAYNLLSGGPLRGTELNKIIYKNTEIKLRSLIYIKEENIFRINTDYYKSKNIKQTDTNNYRFIPPKLSKITLIYLLTIVPFKDYIYKNYYKVSDYSSPYLFTKNNRILEANIISNRLEIESSKFFRRGLKLKSYRKIINYIIKTKFNNTTYNSSDSSNDSDLIEDKQANRTTRTSFNYYYNINGESVNLIELNKIKKFSILYFTYFNLLDLSTTTLNISKALKKLETNNTYTILNNLNITNIEYSNLLASLKKFYNSNKVSFTNIEQKEAIIEVIRDITYLTYINKTGSGKSLIYLLPSFIKRDDIFIVITPRITLKNDLYNRAKALKLNPLILEEGPSLNSNLLFISLENINTYKLDNIISIYKRYNKKITIILDEIHLFLIESTFRFSLKYISTILKYKVNLIFITATLPLSLLNLLNNTFSIEDYNKVIRGTSNRSNIKYTRLFYNNYKDKVSLIRDTLSNINREDPTIENKVLLFVTSKKIGLELEEALNIPFIYKDREDYLIVLEEFITSKVNRVLITTSILEVGLDIKEIKYTINIDPIYSLISIIQSSGRIRNSGESYIITRTPNKYTINLIKEDSILNSTISTIEEFNKLDLAFYNRLSIEENCLRIPINLFLDNNYNRCSINDSKCSICLEKEKTLNTTKENEENRFKELSINYLNLKAKLLDLFNNYCLFCLLKNTIDYKHRLISCSKIDREILLRINNIITVIPKDNLLKKNTACFKCLLPRNICLELNNEYNIIENKCLFNNFNYIVIYLLIEYKEIIRSINIIDLFELNKAMSLKLLLEPITINNTNTIKVIDILYKLDIIDIVTYFEELESKESSIIETTSSITSNDLSNEEDNLEEETSIISNSTKNKDKTNNVSFIEENSINNIKEAILSNTNTRKEKERLNLLDLELELDTTELDKDLTSNDSKIIRELEVRSSNLVSNRNNLNLSLKEQFKVNILESIVNKPSSLKDFNITSLNSSKKDEITRANKRVNKTNKRLKNLSIDLEDSKSLGIFKRFKGREIEEEEDNEEEEENNKEEEG